MFHEPIKMPSWPEPRPMSYGWPRTDPNNQQIMALSQKIQRIHDFADTQVKYGRVSADYADAMRDIMNIIKEP